MVRHESDGIITSNIYDGEIYERLNPLVEKLAAFLFRRVDFDAESLATLKEFHSPEKHIVYASFHSSNISLLIFYNLLRKKGLRPPVFALEYNPFLLQQAGFVWKRIVKLFNSLILRKKYRNIFDTSYVKDILLNDDSIILSLMSRLFFMRRYTEIKYDPLVHLVEVQKSMDKPVYLVPQMIFWNRNPERSSAQGPVWASPRDFVTPRATGDKGLVSGWIATLRSLNPAFVRISAPINLKEEILNSRSDDSRQIAIELRNRLLGIYHHEKRTILGPVVKSRQEMMERVLYHKNVLDTIETVAREEKKSPVALRKKAMKYYREIAADYSVTWITLFKKFMNYVFRRIYDGISYDPEAIRQIREAAQRGPLVLAPCHKSHMDYLILSYLLYENKMFPPFIAAGVNLSFFPLGNLFRHSGAFFIRRSFRGKKLYSTVFRQYVKSLVSEGYTIEFFIEGGRTRTGKPVFPKLGFLSYLIEALEEGYHKDLIVVPIAINYDRILEERTYVQELKGKQKKNESVSSVLESRHFLKRKYGKVYVSFNKPFSIKEIMDSPSRSLSTAEQTANTIIRKINEVTMVTPFALVTAAILLCSVKGFSRNVLEERVGALLRYLRHLGVHMSESLEKQADINEIMDYVLTSYLEDRIVEEMQVQGAKNREVIKDHYVLRDDNRAQIVFYKNSIIHYFISISFSCLALLALRARGGGALSGEDLRAEYYRIRELFSRDFLYADWDDCGEDFIPPRVSDYLRCEGLIGVEGGSCTVNEEKTEDIRYLAKICQDTLESYLIVARTLVDRRISRIGRRELITDVRKEGVTLYHSGIVRMSESLSMSNYNTALERYVEAGVLKEQPSGSKHTEITMLDRDLAQRIAEQLKTYLDCIQ